MSNSPDPREVLDWVNGINDGVSRDDFEMPATGSKWYIVPSAFLNRWKSDIEEGKSEDYSIENSNLILDDINILKLDSEQIIKPGLSLGQDYELVPPKAWDYFKSHYSVDTEIERESKAINDMETQIEVSLKPVKLTIIEKNGNFKYRDPRVIYTSHKSKVASLRNKIVNKLKEDKLIHRSLSTQCVRLWKLEPSFNISYLLDKQPFINGMLPAILLKEDMNLEEAQLADEDLVIVEQKDVLIGWRLKEPNCFNPSLCKYCYEQKLFGLLCDCKAQFYCEEKCMKSDRSHNCRPSYSSTNKSKNYVPRKTKVVSLPPPTAPTSGSRRGITGLQNLGNTCYMNSGLQCLSNTQFLSEYFLTDEFYKDLNTMNCLGSGGRVAEEFSGLLKEMWYGINAMVSPWQMKQAFCQFAKQFSGFHQHDGQEMLGFLLDGLHEDVNRVQAKPYVEEIKQDGLQEAEIADKFWEMHLLRNQSVIVDQMHGQYRSEVTCPNCNHKSLSFDPFSMVSLHIPEKSGKPVDITFVPVLGTPLKMKVQGDRYNSIKTIKDEVARIVKNDSLNIAGISNKSYFEKVFSDNDTFDKVYALYAYEMPNVSVDELGVIVEIFKESKLTSSALYFNKSPFSYPRIILFSKDATLKQLYFQIYKVIFEEEEDFVMEFPEYHNGEGSNLFKLNFVNPWKKMNLYSTSAACLYCQKKGCSNCEVPFSDIVLDSFMRENLHIIKLEMILSKRAPIDELEDKLNDMNIHDSANMSNDKMLDKNVSILSCLEAMRFPEQLDGNNTSYCTECKDHVRGFKKIELYKIPNVLVIHLKRFKQVGYHATKNNAKVSFPLTGLDMSPYCLTRGGVYDLYAVCNHFGSMSFGHYTAYAKNYMNGEWYEFDDGRVSPLKSEAKIIGESSYVLFYQRRI